MRVLGLVLAVSTLVVAGGCERQAERAALDASVAADLRLLDSLILAGPAASAQAVTSPLELGLEQAESLEPVAATRAAAPVQPARTPARTAPRPAATRTSSPAPAPAPQPRVETVKHTKRDAAIGAGAGAVIGATVAGRGNRVKGAVIGGVVGGVAGAVIGNNVDKSTRVVYD